MIAFTLPIVQNSGKETRYLVTDEDNPNKLPKISFNSVVLTPLTTLKKHYTAFKSHLAYANGLTPQC
jgi:hypothetical protein